MALFTFPAFTFPVPEGLLDLLRDFTVAVVHNEPDDLERYAAEYFRDLAASMDRADAASVECSKSRSYLEFDESMYVGYVRSDDVLCELGSSHGSQRSVDESQRSHATGDEDEAEEKCPDEAEKCLEKMRAEGTWPAEADMPRDCAAVETAADEQPHASAVASASNVDRESTASSSRVAAAARDGEVRDSTVRESTVAETEAGAARESSARAASPTADESEARESTVVRPGSTVVRDSTMKPADDVESVKSAASAKSPAQ